MLKSTNTLIFSVLFSALFSALSVNISYADTGTPRERIEITSAKIMELLMQDEFNDPKTKAQVIEKLEIEVMDLFDFEEFSVRTIGPRWKQFDAKQKIEFQTAFTDLLRNSYIDTLDNYNGQALTYVGEISSANKKRVEVHTLFKGQENNYPVSFRMLTKNNTWVVYDVIIEGISMIKNYREQFRNILASSSPDELIKRVQDKAIEKKEKMHSN